LEPRADHAAACLGHRRAEALSPTAGRGAEATPNLASTASAR